MNKYLAIVFSTILLTACGGGSSSSPNDSSSNSNTDKQSSEQPNDNQDNSSTDDKPTFSSDDVVDDGEDISQYVRAPSYYKDGTTYKTVLMIGNGYGNLHSKTEGISVTLKDTENTANARKGSIVDMAKFAITGDAVSEPEVDDFQLSSGNLIDTTSKSYQLYKGQREAELLKFHCLDGITLGQQELQMTTDDLSSFINTLSSNSYCSDKTQVLAANLSEAKMNDLLKKGIDIKPYLTEEGSWGKTIAWIGVAYNEDLRTTTDKVQQAIDELYLKDIKHIGLVSAMGTKADKTMLESLTEVDVIVGRIDDSITENDFKLIDDTIENIYSTESVNRQGNKVCLNYNSNQITSYSSFTYTADFKGNIMGCDKKRTLLAFFEDPDNYGGSLQTYHKTKASINGGLYDKPIYYTDGLTLDSKMVDNIENKYPVN